MSKKKYIYLIKQKSFFRMAFVLLFCLVFALVVFYIKREELKEYTIYDAKVIGFTNVNVTESVPSIRGSSSRTSYTRDIPIIEYKNDEGKIISYEDGSRVLFSSFDLNEKIKVLENKENKYKVKVYSFFYFWIHIYEIIIFFLLLFIFYVFISVFVFRDFYISDF